VPLGLLGGLILSLLAGVRNPWVRWPLMAWVDFFRAFPPLVLLIFLFAGSPFIGLQLSGFTCVCIAFFLNTGAYYGEILRAGIESVPGGQIDAARSTGLGRLQTQLYVVLPQAVRLTIPPLTNRTIAITKGTALGATVAVGEILYQAQTGYSFSYNPSPLTLGAIAYLILFIPVVWFGRWVETRFAWKR
jgi:polar amino acid transport system permease protein